MVAHLALNELMRQLSLAASGEEVGQALLTTAKRFGFTSAIVVDVTQLFNRIGPALIFASAGRAAIEVFDQRHPFMHHPLMLRAQSTERPFLLSSVREETGASEDDWWDRLPPHVRQSDGLIVPVHERGRLAWYAGFTGREPDLGQRTLAVMAAAAHAAYSRFQELLDSDTQLSPLTPREAECLHWVAQGKTDAETATILNISPRTVRFHVSNAKRRLGVTSRIQAVAKGASGAA